MSGRGTRGTPTSGLEFQGLSKRGGLQGSRSTEPRDASKPGAGRLGLVVAAAEARAAAVATATRPERMFRADARAKSTGGLSRHAASEADQHIQSSFYAGAEDAAKVR